jgi:hypothetical protein
VELANPHPGPVMLVSLLFGMVDALKGAALPTMPDFMAHLPLSDRAWPGWCLR